MKEQTDSKEQVVDIDSLRQDTHNFNRGTEEGQQLMERSFKELGAGRSIVKMGMSVEEFLEHVKIDGCLTVEGKQYVEMKDVLLLIEMALEQNENALRNCLQIEISEEEFNNAEFDVTDYVNKKIKKAWFEKALEFYKRPFNFPFNNVK